MATAETNGARTVAELREGLLRDKAARRRYLTTAPLPEKLRILEEMRDTTRALKAVRERNKSKIRVTNADKAAKPA